MEHTFVTTLEAPEAMRRASELLASRGYIPVHGHAFAVGESANWNTLEMKRGKKASRAKSVVELPQLAHLQYDRGRISLALSIEPNYAWGGGGMNAVGFGIDTTNPVGNPRKMRLHTQLLTAQAIALEESLARHKPAQLCLGQWDQVERVCLETARKRKVRNWIIVGIFLLFIGGIFVLVVGNEMKWFR